MTTYALRTVNDDDHKWLVELHNDPVVLYNMTHPQPITMAHHLAWWSKISHDHRQLRLIFTIDGERVGFTKFYDIDRANQNCVLGADIHKSFRGRGLAKIMWSLMLDKCFDELGMHRVSLTTAAYNGVAVKTYEGLGFHHEGTLTQSLWRDNKFHDQYCMYMLDMHWKHRSTQAIGGRA